MLKQITWQEYLSTMAILAIIYYMVVIGYFYRKDISWLIASRKEKRSQDTIETSGQNDASISKGNQQGYEMSAFEKIEEENFIEAEALVDRAKEALDDAAKREYEKRELLQLLRIIFHDYPSLRHTHFRPGVNDLILGLATKVKDLNMNVGELDALWD